jgi:tRNA(Leu) C34 or U34 (ribose-2'-O)-methylase TrmL
LDGPVAGDPAADDPTAASVGVGPHPRPWPDDPRLDPALLAGGDRRNVLDRYRYWTVDAIVAELDTHRRPLHVAVQNWEHDFNIGSIIRTANAFNVAGVHIVGRRRWNRRGAMVTDRYLRVCHHPDVADLVAGLAGLPLVGVDNVPGAAPLETTRLPAACCLLFGSEGPGLTDEALAACAAVVAIAQDGSTRSLNAGAAAAIAMYHWSLQHAADGPGAGPVGGPKAGPTAPRPATTPPLEAAKSRL